MLTLRTGNAGFTKQLRSYLIGLLCCIPFAYFHSILPLLTTHQSIDLRILGVIFASCLYAAWKQQQEVVKIQTPATTNPYRAKIVNLQNFLLLLLLGASAWLRLYHLDFNVPYMDELLNFELRYMGNGHFIASDSRFWGVIAHYSNAKWGLSGVRAINGVLGTLVVACLYFITSALCKNIKKNNNLQFVPFFAALIFSFSTPALFTSNLATHDTLALLLFLLGFLQLIIGVEKNDSLHLTLAAFFLCFSFISRFFILVMLPIVFGYLLYAVSVKIVNGEKIPDKLNWFWRTLLASFAIFTVFNFDQISGSISLGSYLSANLEESGFFFTLYNVLLQVLPVCIILGLCRLCKSKSQSPISEQERRLRIFLWSATLLLPAVHLLKASDFTCEKNLAYSIIFGSILVSLELSKVFTLQNNRPLLLCAKSLIFFISFCALLWASTVVLIPITSRRDFAHLVKPTITSFFQHPIHGLTLGLLRLEQQRWLDPDPVRKVLVEEGLAQQKIAVFGLYGGQHINLHLAHTLGRDQSSGDYYADPHSGWKKDTFEYANDEALPVIIAVIPEAKVLRYDRIPEYPNYRIEQITRIEGIAGNYGRVLVLVDPLNLNMASVPEALRPYYRAQRILFGEIPEAIASLDLKKSLKMLQGVEQITNSIAALDSQFILTLDTAEAYTMLGEGTTAHNFFSKAKETAQLLPQHVNFLKIYKKRLILREIYRNRITQDKPQDLSISKGIDLLKLGAAGATSGENANLYNSKSQWLDFNPPISIPDGAIIRIDTTLSGANIRALRFVKKAQPFETKGAMIVLPLSSGRQVIYIKIEEALLLKRFDDQIGPQAWGELGGTFSAKSQLHSLTLIKDEELPF